jgi:AcrR family transcriptional regulator
MAGRAGTGATSAPATEPRPRLAETVADQRREAVARAIERVAIELFAARPMAEVKVEEIAATAGVGIRTLYRYFPTKEQIFAGLPRRGAEQVVACMRARPASESPFEALRASLVEVEGGTEMAELEQWLRAVVNSDAADRIARMALVVSTRLLSAALAERAGLPADDLWPQMAGTMAAGALIVGTQQWALAGGKLIDHQLAALEIAKVGIGRQDPGPSRPASP